jgi:RNA polymerase sigma factor (sigma-70 family)
VQHLRRLAGGQLGAGLTDAQLLERWLALRDEAAFEVIASRHGPMVLSICGRLLPCSQDVEDAFQATMLIFLRKAASVRKAESLASWLYKVAYRVSTRARVRSAARSIRENHGFDLADRAAPTEPRWDQSQAALVDDEINKLPAKYRAAFVLCYLEGKTNEEAARELGCPVGTVFSRLDSARKRLRARLAGHAWTEPAERFVTKGALAAVPVALMDPTIKACLSMARGQPAPSGVSTAAFKLMEGVLLTMFMKKVGVLAASLFVLAALGTGAGFLRHRVGASEKPPFAGEPAIYQDVQSTQSPTDEAAKKQSTANANYLIDVPARYDGVLLFVGTPGSNKEGQADTRRLRLGDKVKKGQVLAQLDPTLVEAEVQMAEAKVAAAQAEFSASEKTRDEANQRFQTQQKLLERGKTTMEDMRGARLSYDRYFYEVKSKQAAVEVAKVEVQRSQRMLKSYTIRSPEDGVVRRIYKHAGEGVKSLEPVVQIEISERDHE